MYEFAVTPAVTQLRRPGVTIDEVTPGGLANELELRAGDRIVKVNGRAVRDYLDFRFQTAGETELVFRVRKTGGCITSVYYVRRGASSREPAARRYGGCAVGVLCLRCTGELLARG